MEEPCFISDLNHLSGALLTQGDAHTLTPLLGVYSPCLCLKLFLCVLSHVWCCVSNNKLHTCFYSPCLPETFLLSTGSKNQGNSASSL